MQPWRFARPTHPLHPLETLDDLVEVLLTIVDRTDGRTAIRELALDGLAALGQHQAPDVARRMGPLVARVNQFLAQEDPGWNRSVAGDFVLLVAGCLDPERPRRGPKALGTPQSWLHGRIREVAELLHNRQTARLLARPTDTGGWIDPLILAERVVEAGDAALTRELDVAVALIRLAPWGRAAARDRLAGVDGTLAAVVRAACGSGEDVAVTGTVARALQWQLDQPAGAALHNGYSPPPMAGVPGPDAYKRARAAAGLEGVDWSQIAWGQLEHMPEQQAWRRWNDHLRQAEYGLNWAASQWPGNTGWLWASWSYAEKVLGRLLDPAEPLPEPALPHLIRAAAANEPTDRTLATDILSQAIGDGRLSSAALAGVLRTEEWRGPTAGRVVTALSLAAGTGALARGVVRRALVASAASWVQLPATPLCAILSLLDELSTQDGCGVTDPAAVAALTPRREGRTKTATLVRRLLAHAPGPDWPEPAATEALLARLRRADR